MFDLLIKNAKVLDGLGNDETVADIGITGDTVSEIGSLGDAEAERVIDADGLHAAPGFIDMHTHSGFLYLVNPKAESKVHQGVTTEVVGHCGTSVAPLKGDAKTETESLTKILGIEIDWETFDEFNAKVSDQGVALNIVHLLGHGTLRDAVMGSNKLRKPVKRVTNPFMCKRLIPTYKVGRSRYVGVDKNGEFS